MSLQSESGSEQLSRGLVAIATGDQKEDLLAAAAPAGSRFVDYLFLVLGSAVASQMKNEAAFRKVERPEEKLDEKVPH